MKVIAAALLLVTTAAAQAQQTSPAQRVAEDARAVRRIAEASRRDFPSSVIDRIVQEDLDLLRGRQSDGTYQYAHYERVEANRISDRYAVRSSNEADPDVIDVGAETVYRMSISVPNRRLLVARNRRAWIERVELDYTPFGAVRRSENIEVKKWIAVGESTSVDLPDIAKRVRAKIVARVDEADGGPATIEVGLLQAKLVDNNDSPYFLAVQTLNSLARAADKSDLSSVKTLSAEVVNRLGVAPNVVAAVATPPPPPPMTRVEPPAATTQSLEAPPTIELYMELQAVEDLLTGTEAERREGLDKLHQLVRKLRPGSER